MAETPEKASRPKRRWLRWLAIASGLLIVLVLVGGFFLGRYLRAVVQADELEKLINDALGPATDGLYTASVGDIEWRSGGLSLRLTDLSLMLDPEVVTAMDAAGTTPAVLFQIQHTTVDVVGIDLWSVIRGNGFRALSLSIDEPLIQMSGLENVLAGSSAKRGPATRGDAAGPSTDDTDAEGQADPQSEAAVAPTGAAEPALTPSEEVEAIDRKLPPLQIWSVSVNNASLESYRRDMIETDDVRDTFSLFESLEGVDIGLDNVDLAHPDQTRLLFADDLSIDIDKYYYLWPDGLHEESHGPISVSTGGGYIRVSNYTFTPTFERRDHVAEDGSAPTSRRVTIDSIRVEGLDFQAILDHMNFQAAEFNIEGARAEIYSDPSSEEPDQPTAAASVTRPITSVRPGALLTEALNGLPEIRVDRLHVGDFNFSYYVDRDDTGWLEQPRLFYGAENVRIDLAGYASGPEIIFDPARPFFADAGSASAERSVATLGGGRHRLEVDGWSSSSNERRLSVAALRVVPQFDRRTVASRGTEPPDRFELTTGSLVFDGLNYGSLIEDVDVEVTELRIEDPVVKVTGSETEAAAAQRQEEERTPAETIGELLLGLPNIQIDRVVLQNANYEAYVDRTEDGWLAEPLRRFRMVELDMNFDAMQHREGDGYDASRPLLSQAADATIGAVEVALGDGFQQLTVRNISMSSTEHDISVESVEVAPTTDDPAALAAHVLQGSVPQVKTGPITLVGRIVPRYIEDGRIVLESLEIQQPEIVLLELRASTAEDQPPASTDDSNSETLAQLLDELPPIQIGRFTVVAAHFERRVGGPNQDWSQLPEPLEAIGGLDLTLEGVDTRASTRRLLMSDRVELNIDDLQLAVGETGGHLTLGTLALSSDSDTLTIDDALFTTRSRDGNNDYRIGRIELTNVPYGRTFRALIEPRKKGTPVLAAMADKDMHLMIDGIEGVLDDGDRELNIGQIRGAAAAGSLEIASLSLRPTMADADPSTPGLQLRNEETMVSTDAIEISGVDFERLANEGALEADLLALHHPVVSVVIGIDDPPADDTPSESGGRSPAETIAAGIENFPVLDIDQVRINNISFYQLHAVDGEPVRAFDDIQLAIDGLDLRPDRDPTAPEGVLYADDIRLQMPRQRTWLNDVGYEIDVGPIAISTGAGTIDLGQAAYLPPYTTDVFLSRTSFIEGDRMEVHVGNLSISDVDFGRLLRNEGVHVGNIRLADWTLHILSDKHKPKNPRAGRPGLPNEAFQNLALPLSIDQIDIVNGTVRYSERNAKADEPGHLWWDQLNGAIVNVSNEPSRMTVDTPAVLTVEARMLDEIYLKLVWKLPLLEPGPTMSYSAELSPFRASLLTSILEPIEGLRITDGVFDQTWFNVDIKDGHATGTFNGLYHDLKIQLVNRNTGGRSLKQRLISFAANIILPSNNRDKDGKPARYGEIDYTFPAAGAPIFKVFWDAIKSGVLDLAM